MDTKQLAFGNAKAIDEALGKLAGIEQKVGELDDLETEDKSSIVNAINEAAQSGGGGDTDEIEEVSASALVELKEYIDSLLNGITTKGKIVMSTDVVDTLVSLSSLKPLSAFMGNVLNNNALDNEKVIASAFCSLTGMLKPAAIAPEYSANKVYAEGAYCINDGLLYKCSTAITKPEFFNSEHWTQTCVTDIINA